MKKLLIAALGVCALAGFTGCGNSGIKYDYKGKGKLVSAIEYNYNYSSSNGGLRYKSRIDTIYNENNDEVFSYYYGFTEDKKWKLSSKTETTYDADRNKLSIETARYSESSDGRKIITYTTTEYQYENGLLVKEIKKNGFDEDITTYTYDAKGNRIKEQGNDLSYAEYEFDENNNCIRERWYRTYNSGESWIGGMWEYTYNANNKETLILISDLDDGGTWVTNEKKEYTYDSNNNRTSETTSYYREDAWVYYDKHERTFDEDGNILTSVTYNWYNETGVWNKGMSYEYTYDKKGNITLELGYTSDGELCYRDVFKYNKKGEKTSIKMYYLNRFGDMVLAREDEYTYKYYK